MQARAVEPGYHDFSVRELTVFRKIYYQSGAEGFDSVSRSVPLAHAQMWQLSSRQGTPTASWTCKITQLFQIISNTLRVLHKAAIDVGRAGIWRVHAFVAIAAMNVRAINSKSPPGLGRFQKMVRIRHRRLNKIPTPSEVIRKMGRDGQGVPSADRRECLARER